MTIALVATGGTIASLTDPATGAVEPAVEPSSLIESVRDVAEVVVTDVCRVSGWNMTPDLMLDVARAVDHHVADGAVCGVVVTHGTDTVAETAFLLDILRRRNKPVILACAMRSADEIGADGPRNLSNAFVAASDAECAAHGVLICVGDELHAARWAAKLDSMSTSAFGSPGRGPIGRVSPTGVSLHGAPFAPQVWALGTVPEALATVPLVKTFGGMEAKAFHAIVEDSRGVVIEGTGLGNVPGSLQDPIRKTLRRGIPVVIATQSITGGTRPTYGGLGGGITLRDIGVDFAGRLSAAKARLLLAAALASESDTERAMARFRQAIGALQ